VLPIADAMLIMRDGQVAAYGPRDEVLAALAKAQQPADKPALTPPVATAAA
jgi:ATP-binding cassette subfamily C exporter for protease/lipase